MAEKVGSVYIEIQAKMGSLEKDLKELEARLKGTDRQGKQTGSSLASMGKLIAGAGITGAVIGLGTAALKASAQMEQNRVAFTTMLGSASKANKLLKEMTEFAASTPFQLPEIQNAGKQLLAFGVESEKIIPTLTRLGDVSAALNIPIGELSDLYGKARVQGTLYAEDLNQLAGRGIPIFTELAKVMGVNANEVKKLGSEGKITFNELEVVFENMTKEGSQFGGLMQAQSQTLSGQWSNFNDNLGKTAVLFGDQMSPAAKDFLTVLNSIVSKYNEWIELNNKLSSEQEKYISLTGMASAGLTDVNDKLVSIYNQGGKNAEYARLYSQYLQGQVKLSDSHVKQIETMLGLSRSLSDINYQTNKNELDSWKQRGMIIDKVEKSETKKRSGGSGSKVNTEFKQAYDARLAYFDNLLKEQDRLEAEYGSVSYARFVMDLDAKAQKYATFTGGLTQLSGQLAQLSQMNASNQTAEVDNRMQKELEAIENRYNTEKELIENSALTEEEKNAKLKALDEQRARDEKAAQDKAAKEKRKIAHEAAKQQKMLAIFDTLVSIPTAAFQAFKSAQVLPFPASAAVGAAMAAAATGLGLAKLKLIKDQPLPALAEGGIVPAVPGGNQFTIGEAGSAEAVIPLNDSTLSRLAGMINNAGGSGQTYAKLPPMSDTAVFNMIYQASQNGDLYIDSRAVIQR